jgi:hypothetical protein
MTFTVRTKLVAVATVVLLLTFSVRRPAVVAKEDGRGDTDGLIVRTQRAEVQLAEMNQRLKAAQDDIRKLRASTAVITMGTVEGGPMNIHWPRAADGKSEYREWPDSQGKLLDYLLVLYDPRIHFTENPIVLISPVGTNGEARVSDVTTTGFRLRMRVLNGGGPVDVHWIAYGVGSTDPQDSNAWVRAPRP